jgi:hypothetical protein
LTSAKAYIESARRRRDIEQYVASYRQQPETDAEVAATDAFLHGAFAGEQ